VCRPGPAGIVKLNVFWLAEVGGELDAARPGMANASVNAPSTRMFPLLSFVLEEPTLITLTRIAIWPGLVLTTGDVPSKVRSG